MISASYSSAILKLSRAFFFFNAFPKNCGFEVFGDDLWLLVKQNF